jgi:acyl-CoA synthetase (AMP-forming)/AMP-acid ligase II
VNPVNIPEMVARNARMYPDEEALVDIDPEKGVRRGMTWKEFNEKIDRVANALIDRGIKPGDKVSQIMYNSSEFLAIFLGILRCGAWAAPLSFRLTSHEIKYCIDNSEAKILFLDDRNAGKVEACREELGTIQDYIFLGKDLPAKMDTYEGFIASASSNPVNLQATDEEGAALYFTSGTTGQPKPILLSHKNMECAAITNNYNRSVDHRDNFLNLPPLYHAGSIMMWYAHVIVGAPSTILLGVVTSEKILKAVHQEKITILFLVTPWAQDILSASDRGELSLSDYDVRSCRLLCMGAQPVPPSLIKRWKETFPHMDYITDYGLGEANGPGCMHLGPGDEEKWGSIGKPSFNWEARIVDFKGKDVPPGQVGELIVRGNGVMKGYYRNPEKTAETIRNGWCYTGDMAKRDPNGFFWLVDRKKDLIITGGENIYPVEVEEVLHLHAKIYDAAVIGTADERMGEVPIAIISPKPGEELSVEELMQFCKERLPKFKVPKEFIFDQVPRNPTGKIEKQKLRAKYSGGKETFKLV